MKKNSSSVTARAIIGLLFLITGVALALFAVKVNLLGRTSRTASIIASPSPLNPTRTTGNLVFAPATLIDTQRTEGEPINHIDKDGNYWESGPWGFSTEQSFI